DPCVVKNVIKSRAPRLTTHEEVKVSVVAVQIPQHCGTKLHGNIYLLPHILVRASPNKRLSQMTREEEWSVVRPVGPIANHRLVRLLNTKGTLDPGMPKNLEELHSGAGETLRF